MQHSSIVIWLRKGEIITSLKIMFQVDRQTFQLPQNEVDKIEKILRKGIDRQKGIEVESSGSGEEEDEEEGRN